MKLQSVSSPAADDWSPWTSRLVVWSAFALLCSGGIVFFAGSATLAAVNLILIDGGVALLWVLSATGVAWWLARPWTHGTHWTLRLATAAALGMGLYSLLLLALGLTGALNRPVAWTIFFAGLVAGALRLVPTLLRLPVPNAPSPTRLAAGLAPRGLRKEVAWDWLWLAAALPLAVMLVAATVVPGMLWQPDPHPYDVMSYHLQVPREWYELGRIAPLQHNVFSFFPMAAEVHFLAAMHLMGGPWDGMYVCQFLSAWQSVAMVLAVYGAGRTLRPTAPPGQSIAAAALVACVPWIPMLGSVAYAEPALLLFGGTSIAWLLLSMDSRRTSHVILAGALAGFACGAKYPAVPMLVLGATVAYVLASLLRPREDGGAPPSVSQEKRGRERVRIALRAAIFGAVALSAFSPWLIRNAAWAGNPVFPLAMKTLGKGHYTDEQVARFDKAHQAPPDRASATARMRTFVTEFKFHPTYGYLFIPTAILAIIACGRSRRAVFGLMMLAVMIIVWLGFTHLIGRFLVLAIPLGGIMLASLPLHRFGVVAVTVVLLIVSALSIVHLHTPLLQAIVPYGGATIGATDLTPEEFDRRQPDQRVALVGDAAAFRYRVPSSHLVYRTVFDLPAPAPGAPWYTAWTAGQPVDWLFVVAPEVRRLHSTYAGVPALPPGVPPDGVVFIPVPKP